MMILAACLYVFQIMTLTEHFEPFLVLLNLFHLW